MPKPPCKKTMQHSSELAESHRPLTVTDEVKTAQTETQAFKDATIPERKRNLPLPKLISLDDYRSLMTQGHLLAPKPAYECGGRWQQLGPAGPDGPHRNLNSWNDNTVGPVTLASGYGSNAFPYSAAHVLDPITMPFKANSVNSNLVNNDEGLSNPFWAPPKIPHFTGSTLEVTQMANNSGPKTTCFTLVCICICIFQFH